MWREEGRKEFLEASIDQVKKKDTEKYKLRCYCTELFSCSFIFLAVTNFEFKTSPGAFSKLFLQQLKHMDG